MRLPNRGAILGSASQRPAANRLLDKWRAISMRRSLQRFGWTAVLFIGGVMAGINCKAVWLEPRMPIVLTVGETQPYTVMGLDGADAKGDLTKSPYLAIASSDAEVLVVDQKNAAFIGRKPGHVEIRITFSEATTIVQAFVRELERRWASAGSPASGI
jgi:hypothetical protein